MIKNKQKKQIFILSFILLICISIFSNINIVHAKTNFPEHSREFYVYDNVGIIDRDLENYIIDINKELYSKTGAQVVVAVVDSLEGLDINTYATSLYEKWKIGSKEYDNGLLVVIVPDEGSLWIETGYGLEGALPAGIEKRIIERDIIPSFKIDDYNKGIALGFNSIIEYIEKDYDITLDKEGINDNYVPVQTERELPKLPILIFLLVFGFIDFKFFRGMLIMSILRAFLRGGGGSGGGSGGSSGGGGRSGGGGAGGNW